MWPRSSDAIAIALVALASCSAGDDAATAEEDLSTDGAVTVVQCNPFFAGRYDHYPEKGDTTYATAHRFAKDVAAKHPRTSIIGMEEMLTQTDVDTAVKLLHQTTGHPWSGHLYQTHAHELGAAILWRTDVWTLKEDFGTITIDAFDHGGIQMSYGLPFGGALLERGGRQMAVYAGKLAWNGVQQHGHTLSASELSALRVEEAKTLHAHVMSTTVQHPHASRCRRGIQVYRDRDFPVTDRRLPRRRGIGGACGGCREG